MHLGIDVKQGTMTGKAGVATVTLQGKDRLRGTTFTKTLCGDHRRVIFTVFSFTRSFHNRRRHSSHSSSSSELSRTESPVCVIVSSFHGPKHRRTLLCLTSTIWLPSDESITLRVFFISSSSQHQSSSYLNRPNNEELPCIHIHM